MNKSIILTLLSVVFLICLGGSVLGAECNATIATLTDTTFNGCTVSNDLELETGTYYANTSDFIFYIQLLVGLKLKKTKR